MMATSMLMVTSFYPYGQGETFIVAELGQVSACFEQVEIVPSFHAPGTSPRPERHRVNLDYADTRWGFLRVPRMMAALLPALFQYRWAADLGFVLSHGRKLDNLKELVRALYRARMFERFLAQRADRAQRAGEGRGREVIYCYWLVPEILGAVRFRKASGADIRIVCRAHRGDLYEEFRSGGYAGLRREIVAGIDDIYCISDHGKRYLGQCFPQLAAKFHTARLGVADPGFLNTQPRGGPLSIVSCAFVIASKRLPLIVDAIASLLAADPALEVRWTHIGNGPLLDEVRAYAASRLGERAQAVFKGYLTQGELMALYREESFDVIINVSDSEGIPVSLMEAGAAAIPAVATDVGGNGELVNADNGVLIAADASAATIAAALARFKDRDAARAYRRAARAYWDAHFNAAVNYERFGRQLAGAEAVPAPASMQAGMQPDMQAAAGAAHNEGAAAG
jgi:glycosyltransferase involved in cell wall biosynthesis